MRIQNPAVQAARLLREQQHGHERAENRCHPLLQFPGLFILGHIGIGRAIVGQKGRALPLLPLALGMILPDLIDKSLYYLRLSSFISCTRTFAHTGLFLVGLAAVAWLRRSRAWSAIALGVATHVLLDWTLDQFSTQPSSELVAFAWPFLSSRFASYQFNSPLDQLEHLANWRILVTEAIGLVLLVREYRKGRFASLFR